MNTNMCKALNNSCIACGKPRTVKIMLCPMSTNGHVCVKENVDLSKADFVKIGIDGRIYLDITELLSVITVFNRFLNCLCDGSTTATITGEIDKD